MTPGQVALDSRRAIAYHTSSIICTYAMTCIYGEAAMRELTRTLKVLSDESRLRVLNLLQERECCVCEVMQVMDISQSKASRIMSALCDAGLLRLRREGKWALYSIEDDATEAYVRDIVAAITAALKANPLAVRDREKLSKAERVGPACAAGRKADLVSEA